MRSSICITLQSGENRTLNGGGKTAAPNEVALGSQEGWSSMLPSGKMRKFCSMRVTIRKIRLRANTSPTHTRFPAPNGMTFFLLGWSAGTSFPSASRKRSGRNSKGSPQIFSSWCMAQRLTQTVVPAGMVYWSSWQVLTALCGMASGAIDANLPISSMVAFMYGMFSRSRMVGLLAVPMTSMISSLSLSCTSGQSAGELCQPKTHSWLFAENRRGPQISQDSWTKGEIPEWIYSERHPCLFSSWWVLCRGRGLLRTQEADHEGTSGGTWRVVRAQEVDHSCCTLLPS